MVLPKPTARKVLGRVAEKKAKEDSAKKEAYGSYQKSLEKILDGVAKDYYAGLVDINRHQIAVARAYLWVAVALIGAYIAAFDRYNSNVISTKYAFALGVVALVLACIGFGICLYSMPARRGYMAIPKQGWGEFSHEVYGYLSGGQAEAYSVFLTYHIARIDEAYAHNFKTNQARAKSLRITSWILIASFSVSSANAIYVVSDGIYSYNEGVMKMAQDDSSKPSASTQGQPQLSVPAPPPSANTGSGGRLQTNSEQPASSRTVFVTDSVDKKK